MSTREGVYGETDATEVPNAKLITGLSSSPLRLLSTLQDPDHDDGRLAIEVAGPASGPGGFEVQAPILRPGFGP
jgi:hypothetical protein